MKRIAFVIFVLPVLLFSEWDHLFKGAGDPALAYHVNVITGNLQLFFEDQIVEGAVPIHLHRTYSSAGHYERTVPKDPNLKKLNTIWQLEGGWDFLPHLQLLVDPRVDAEDFLRVYLKEPNGEMITYRSTGKKSHHKLIMKPEKRGGQNFGVISGRLNPNNH